jgi:hypothetical protein
VSIGRGIEVTNQSGQKIDAQLSVNGTKATVVFSQPVAPDTMLAIEIQGVHTPYIDHTWQYQVYARLVEVNAEIPLGLARIQTSAK